MSEKKSPTVFDTAQNMIAKDFAEFLDRVGAPGECKFCKKGRYEIGAPAK